MVDKSSSFLWQLVMIYCTAYAELKLDFFTELHDLMESKSLPTLLGGDFNLVSNSSEKSNETCNAQWSFMFNDWINMWGLVEIKTSNRLFTWSNNQHTLILATLDKFFASTDWEQRFPLTTAKALRRLVSDHISLVMDTGSNIPPPPKMFLFEKWWISQEGFVDIVCKSWGARCDCSSAIGVWQFKLRRLRKTVKGWDINLEAALQNKKKSLLQEFDILDVFSEQKNLFGEELDAIFVREETKA
jgi:hypothetical protein